MLLFVGRRFTLLLLIVYFIAFYIFVKRAEKGKVPSVRTIPAIAAIDEAVGRAAEMGRPVFVTPGQAALTGVTAAQTLSGLACLEHAAGLCASAGVPFIALTNRQELFPLVIEKVKEQFLLAGKPEEYQDEYCRFIPYGIAYDITVMAIAERERPAACIAVGYFWHACIYLIEAMHRAGAFTIGGSELLPFVFVGACDYALLGDEIVNADAVLTKDPIQLGSVGSIDLIKFISAAIVILGVLLISFGSDIILKLLEY